MKISQLECIFRILKDDYKDRQFDSVTITEDNGLTKDDLLDVVSYFENNDYKNLKINIGRI